MDDTVYTRDGELRFAAIVVAAGQGLRAGQPLPKQFATWRGKPVVRHSVARLREQGAKEIVVAIPEGAEEIAQEALSGIDGVSLVTGGETRQQSVRNALEALENREFAQVLIHDAARPHVPIELTRSLIDALEQGAIGAIPVLPVVDSLVMANGDTMAGSADREQLRRVQTPQAFRFKDILDAHRKWSGAPDAGDDAQVLGAAGNQVVLVKGDERLAKLTFAEDFMDDMPPLRVGTGFDVHRLVEGEDLWLGGIQLDHSRGLAGHSDADVALHAITDAILGAAAAGDIGQHFSPKDERWRGAKSAQFIRHAATLAQEAGYSVSSIDLTIICEEPKIGPYRDAMRDSIALLLDLPKSAVSVKATTTEGLGFSGRGEGIAAQAVATLIRMD